VAFVLDDVPVEVPEAPEPFDPPFGPCDGLEPDRPRRSVNDLTVSFSCPGNGEEVTLGRTWSTIGMLGSGSGDEVGSGTAMGDKVTVGRGRSACAAAAGTMKAPQSNAAETSARAGTRKVRLFLVTSKWSARKHRSFMANPGGLS
jgi:hypothetical protein